MPVVMEDASSAKAPPAETGDTRIVIGLVNNMPDAAIRSTERQFFGLLEAAAGDLDVSLRLFSLPDVPRSETARAVFMQPYSDIHQLWDARVDGLVVTGAEPRTAELADEPYWGTLTRLIDWAEDNTFSAIYSCLAAHAAVLHMDGINRHALGDKLSGVFECEKASEHALVIGAPESWSVPHSRWNGLRRDELIAKGYQPVTSSDVAGVDSFVKQRKKSLFIFFQGHLEYDSQSLLREYLRDIKRYLDGDRDDYPGMPQGYFDKETVDAFAKVRESALQKRDARLIAEIAGNAATGKLANSWRSPATSIYRNWLSYISDQKQRKTV